MAQQISIQKELFNPVFFLIKHHLADPNIRYIYVFGGSSAAKTYSVAQVLTLESFANKKNVLITRKYGSDIQDSIYSDFRGIIRSEPNEGGFDLGNHFDLIKNEIRCKSNGAYIRFRGMDDSEKVKGIAQFNYVVMEEFSQFDEEDNKQARKRLRGMPNQKIIYIWNPIDELMWQKINLIDKQTWIDCSIYPRIDTFTGVTNPNEGLSGAGVAEHKINLEGNSIYIRTNYLDNWYIVGHPDGKHGYVDQHVINDMIWDKNNDYPYYLVYGLGEWGRADRGGEYYKEFDDERHLFPSEKVEVNPLLPFHISLDENVNPYLSATLWQASGKSVWQIDEFTMRHPDNTIMSLAKRFAGRYAAWTKCPIYIYGDATSQKEDTKQEKGENFFRLFAAELEKYGFITYLRVPHQNPGQTFRGVFINLILSRRGFESIEFVIANNCTETIKDMRYVKEDSDGSKFKKRVRDKITNVAYEEYGHLSDTVDYFVCEYFKEEFGNFMRGKRSEPARVVRRQDLAKNPNYY